MWAYLKETAVPELKDNMRLLRLRDGRALLVGFNEEGFYTDLKAHRFELSPPLDQGILDATDFFTFYQSGYASRPTATYLADTGVYEYKSAKAVLSAVNGGGYAIEMRFKVYEDGKALFMAIWHTGVKRLEGVTLTPPLEG